jgi:hypothetical protein
MPSADTLPAAAARATYRFGLDAGMIVDGGTTVGWRTIGARARHLALGLSATGIGAGCRVHVDLPPSTDAAVVDLAVASTGAILGLDRSPARSADDPSSGADDRLLRIAADGLTGPSGTASIESIAARGAAIDEAQPDRFERLVASIDPTAVLIDERGPGDPRPRRRADRSGTAAGRGEAAPLRRERSDGSEHVLKIDHRGAADVLSSLTRAVAGPPHDGVTRVLVDGTWASAAERLLGLWWPLISGASTCIGSGRTFPQRLVAGQADVVVASGDAWAAVAAELRDARTIRAGSRLERLTLGNGRALVAGEPVGRLGTMARRVAAAAVMPKVLADLGLASCTRALAVGPLDESVRRDLLAAGVPLSSAWLPAGAAMPVTMTEPGSPDRSAGRPLPGWRLALDDRDVVTVEGPGTSARPTGCRGRLDDTGNLWLRGDPR